MTNQTKPEYDVIVIGAGVCGIYMSYRLAELGLRFTVLERAPDLGGTWFWNRYPGCRFDSESETYAFSFSKELMAEWNWTEKFAPRAETEKYLHFVADKFDLRKHMQFDQKVAAARWDEASRSWAVETDDGVVRTTRFLLTAVGLLSTPTPPRYSGVENFTGQSFHTYDHPDGVDYTGKRVAVIGTGSTGVQVIADVADKVGSLTVFQRRPNWCAPLHNGPISPEEMDAIRARYDEILEVCRQTASGFIHDADRRAMSEVSEADREEFWEGLYNSPGFAIWLGNFRDVLTNEAANAEFSKFVERKIRSRVNDPRIADKLVPTDHGFGTRRPPMEKNYYEAYNRDNVRLVDLSETPIEEITRTGIRTSDEEFEFDIIVYATGFDAVTGAFDKINIVGEDGLTLKEKWQDGPVNAYGVAINGFPNLMTVAGPLSGSVATNFPRGIEDAVMWTADFLKYMFDNGIDRFEARKDAELEWGEHVQVMASKILFAQQKSWFTGYNTNLDREYRPRALVYAGGGPRYRRLLSDEAAQNYPTFSQN